MRLRKALALSAALVALAAAAPTATADIGTGGGARPAPALPSRALAVCGGGKSAEFPIGARIRGGPAVYRTGGGSQSWFLDLTNTTDSECTAIHPVVVLTDKARALRPEHLEMEFETTPGGTPRPVSLEHSDRDEIIAVFDGGGSFPGFAVGPGGSVTVRVHLGFTPDAPLGEVVADAALVQRRGDDGDWIGEGGGYRFTVDGPEEAAEAVGAGALAHTGQAGRAYGGELGAGTAAGVAVAVGGLLLLGGRRLRRRTPSR
ncbi:hypothetical protein AB0953_15410 [Streptomyces sp. NPDC046866]|uniref:hypothetical protein n=1 Tax=Streptomyces sp. NPDC046866 TaxID=3154921 RepID=UPI003454E301